MTICLVIGMRSGPSERAYTDAPLGESSEPPAVHSLWERSAALRPWFGSGAGAVRRERYESAVSTARRKAPGANGFTAIQAGPRAHSAS